MTNEEIIVMARQAGLSKVVKAHSDGTMTIELPHPEKLGAFARLVAAAEREACAKVCENGSYHNGNSTTWYLCAKDLEKKIRARGEV